MENILNIQKYKYTALGVAMFDSVFYGPRRVTLGYDLLTFDSSTHVPSCG